MRRSSCLALLILGLPLLGGCTELTSLTQQMATPAPSDPEPAAASGGTKPREVYLRLINGLEAQGKDHAALAYLTEYETHYPGDAEVALLRAQAFLAVNRPAEAEGLYRSLLGGERDAEAENGLGRVDGLRGNWASARAHFQKAAQARPADVKFLNNYGYALIESGDLFAAEFTLRQAAELAPGNEDIRNNLILCLHLAGKAPEVARLVAQIDTPQQRQSVETQIAQWRSRKPPSVLLEPAIAPPRKPPSVLSDPTSAPEAIP